MCGIYAVVIYSSGHASTNSYVPVLSVYGVFAGAYSIQEPSALLFGYIVPQTIVVPVAVIFDGHDEPVA